MEEPDKFEKNLQPKLHVDIGPPNNKDIDTRWV